MHRSHTSPRRRGLGAGRPAGLIGRGGNCRGAFPIASAPLALSCFAAGDRRTSLKGNVAHI
eukprot:15890161-Heterocapsa_arctica.AAC.1